MLVYRMIVDFEGNLERIKEKRWFYHNFSNNGDFRYVSNSNTFKKDRKEGEYLYFYAEDAVRMTQIFKEEWMHKRRNIHIAEFDISIDILAEYLGLGIYKSCYDRNISNDPYYIALEFAIPYKVITDNYRDQDYKHSCITDRLYPIRFFEHFEEAEIHSDVSRDSYKTFRTTGLPVIMKMLNVGILPPEQNYGNRNRYGFSELAGDYPKEEAAKILRKLDNPQRHI